ncbi:ryncolin-1-like [Ostrea edulis]|uniref:ryncolin-1-like n=1 Tax=Ostrea edulis TaxID=37623 RepID=UPI0024AF8D4A|nr:ryncolin-1-like [Ostrea edulis]
MLCLVLCVVFLFHPLLTDSSGIKPHAFVKSEVGSFLKHAPWKHTDMSASISGPMILTLQSKYKLGGGLVFRKKFPEKYKDCSEILKMKPHRKNRDGVYTIYPTERMKKRAFCDMTTEGGGWTIVNVDANNNVVIEEKLDESRKNCSSGDNSQECLGNEEMYPSDASESEESEEEHEKMICWRRVMELGILVDNLEKGCTACGNNAIHDLTKSGKMKLRIDMKKFNREQGFVQYSTFVVGSRSDKYRLKVTGFRGSFGMKDSFAYHNGMKFSTKDSDNDRSSSNCAVSYGNGWWFNTCHHSNLNGVYYRKPTVSNNGMTWERWDNKRNWDYLKSSKMMIKPKT